MSRLDTHAIDLSATAKASDSFSQRIASKKSSKKNPVRVVLVDVNHGFEKHFPRVAASFPVRAAS